jgi:hypothetical protein
MIRLFFFSMMLASAGGAQTFCPPANAMGATCVEQDGIALSARILTARQTAAAFSSELERGFLVAHVVLRVDPGQVIDAALADFTLTGRQFSTKPWDAARVARHLTENAPAVREVTVSPQTTISYESGPRYYDPYEGRVRGGGLRTSAGVGVGIGETQTGAHPVDDRVRELELRDKALAEGIVNQHVEGYLYFPVKAKQKATPLDLVYRPLGSSAELRLTFALKQLQAGQP